MQRETEYVTCNICNSDDSELISNRGQFRLPINVVICKGCSLIYLNPRWTKSEYNDFYESEYDKYYRSNTNLLKVQNTGNQIIDRLSQIDFKLSSSLNILEVGSGSGANLLSFKEQFSKANLFAIEPSLQAQKKLKENHIKLLSSDIDSDWSESLDVKFDLILMRHVLEHFMNPLQVLKKISNSLSKNGILYIAVPNAMKAKKPLLDSWFRIPHTYYFNQQSLNNILSKAGFNPISLKEGDHYNENELFSFSQKSEKLSNLNICEEVYNLQKNILLNQIKEEQKFFYKIKQRILNIIPSPIIKLKKSLFG